MCDDFGDVGRCCSASEAHWLLQVFFICQLPSLLLLLLHDYLTSIVSAWIVVQRGNLKSRSLCKISTIICIFKWVCSLKHHHIIFFKSPIVPTHMHLKVNLEF